MRIGFRETIPAVKLVEVKVRAIVEPATVLDVEIAPVDDKNCDALYVLGMVNDRKIQVVVKLSDILEFISERGHEDREGA